MTQFYCLILLPEDDSQPPKSGHPASETLQAHAELASRYLKLRARRSAIAGEHLLSDPAWDILLDLFVGHVRGKNVTITNACIASRRPSTTSLRYIDRLLKEGLLFRERDTRDHRKVHLRMTDRAFHAVAEWIGALQDQLAGL